MNFSKIQQPKNLLLLALLLGLSFYTALVSLVALTLGNGEYSTISLSPAQYAGFVAIAVCVLVYALALRFFKRVLGLALLLAVFRLVNFLPGATYISFGLGDMRISVEPIFLLLLLGYYLLNRTDANAFIRTYLLPAPTPQKAAQLHREAVDQFKQTFARKTDDNLRQMTQDPKLVATAVTAAEELLAERNAKLILKP